MAALEEEAEGRAGEGGALADFCPGLLGVALDPEDEEPGLEVSAGIPLHAALEEFSSEGDAVESPSEPSSRVPFIGLPPCSTRQSAIGFCLSSLALKKRNHLSSLISKTKKLHWPPNQKQSETATTGV